MPEMPRIVVAGTQSGVGKTSLTLGLVMLLRRRGLRVQTFKVGPDYLDPTYLELASGRPCYNLDGWMMGRDYVDDLFARKAAAADISVIEGVMGLFDSADPMTDEGSTAQVAKWLDAPVVLVTNVHGMARSVAALVHGFASFDPDLRIAGVIANHCGSEGHLRWIKESLVNSHGTKLVGGVIRGGLPELSSRHLGLVSAIPGSIDRRLIEQLADGLEAALSVDEIIRIARSAPHRAVKTEGKGTAPKHCRLGIARDEAFHFYYPDNLQSLERAGCELIEFSPLRDNELPEGLYGLYLGGGYPEEHAAALSQNHEMLRSIRSFRGAIYAECGGLMYLAQGIEVQDGSRFPMVGLLPSWVRIGKKLKVLRYVEVSLLASTCWGRAGTKLRGHEYHYSELIHDPGWEKVYEVKHRHSGQKVREGFRQGAVLASYVHLHFASSPGAICDFVAFLSSGSDLERKAVELE